MATEKITFPEIITNQAVVGTCMLPALFRVRLEYRFKSVIRVRFTKSRRRPHIYPIGILLENRYKFLEEKKDSRPSLVGRCNIIYKLDKILCKIYVDITRLVRYI